MFGGEDEPVALVEGDGAVVDGIDDDEAARGALAGGDRLARSLAELE